MEKCIPFYSPIGAMEDELNASAFHKSVEAFDKGEFRKSIVLLMSYIKDSIKFPASGDVDMTFPHGSVLVSFSIKGDRFRISAPFLKLPTGGAKIALMRQIAELNMAMNLPRIVLQGDNLSFLYEDLVQNCQPAKLYYIFEEICHNADYYDDYYMDKFGAQRVWEPKTETLNAKEKDNAHKIYQGILQTALKNADYFESKQQFSNVCMTLSTALMQSLHTIRPQGPLEILIKETLSEMYEDEPVETIIVKTRKAFAKLIDFDRAKFDDCMYRVVSFIPFKKFSPLNSVQEYLEEPAESADDSCQNKDYMSATLTVLYNAYYLFSQRNLPKKVVDNLSNGLKKASDKSIKDSAKILSETFDSILSLKAPKSND